MGMAGGFDSAPDPLQNVSPNSGVQLNYNPPPPAQPQQTRPQGPGFQNPFADPNFQQPGMVMRPRNNAGGDFWGPVVQRLLQLHLQQSRQGGGGFLGAGDGTPQDRAMDPAGYGKGGGY